MAIPDLFYRRFTALIIDAHGVGTKVRRDDDANTIIVDCGPSRTTVCFGRDKQAEPTPCKP